MSKLIEFLLGSLLIAISTLAFLFFSTLHYILKIGNIDCLWHGSAKAWIDSNQDGRVSPGEEPLENVMIHVGDGETQLSDLGWPRLTDEDGEVQLNISIPNCSGSMLEIYAETPEGFLVTTQPRLEIDHDLWGNLRTDLTYYFGFASEK